jgi:hypothetical protein
MKQEVAKINEWSENNSVSNRTSKRRFTEKLFTNSITKKKTKKSPTAPAALLIGEQKCG